MSLDLLPSLEELDARVASMASAESPSTVFKILLDASRMAAPRAAIFLIRKNEIRGWGSSGYAAEVAGRLRQFESGVDTGWPAIVIAEEERALHRRTDGLRAPDFGQPLPAEASAVVVRVKSQPIAMLLLERSAGEAPWFPQALALLARVAQLRLELDLVQRKLAHTGESVAALPRAGRTEPERPAAATGPRSAAPAAEPTPASESHEIAEAAAGSQRETPHLEAARRFARLVATDIRLYNEDAVMAGRKTGDLVKRLGEHLTRGKETFLRRHGNLGPQGLSILHEAYVNVLAGGNSSLLPTSTVE